MNPLSSNLCQAILEGHSNRILSVAYAPDGRQLASGSDDKTIRLWDLRSQKCQGALEGYSHGILSVAYAPDGRQLASGGDDNIILLWDLGSQKCQGTLEGHRDQVRSVAYSSDGRQLASGSMDKTIRLWDLRSQNCQGTLKGHSNSVRSVAYAPDGRQLASGSYDKTIRLWDLGSQKCQGTLEGHSKIVWSVAYAPDGRQLASGSFDRTIRLWDLGSQKCQGTLKGHSDVVWSVTYAPHGQQLASGSDDKTTRLWDLRSQKCQGTFEGHNDTVSSVAYAPDGRQLASGSGDKTIRLWDVSQWLPAQSTTPTASAAAAAAASSAPGQAGTMLPAPSSSATAAAVAKARPVPQAPAKNTQWLPAQSTALGSARAIVAASPAPVSAINAIAYSTLKMQRQLAMTPHADVHLATWQMAEVVVKQLRLAVMTDKAKEEFLNEGRIMQQLNHPNVVRFYGICQEPEHYCLVMEYVAKGSLFSLLQSPEELPWPVRMQMAKDMAVGLAFLHAQAPIILHRDMKSLNVLIDVGNRAKLTDFGLSQVKHESKKHTTALKGTLAWSAPELLEEDLHYSTKSDVYALGMTLWELCSRQEPFAGLTEMGVMRKVDRGERPAIPAEAPAALVSLIQKCWAQTADARPTAGEAAAMITST